MAAVLEAGASLNDMSDEMRSDLEFLEIGRRGAGGRTEKKGGA